MQEKGAGAISNLVKGLFMFYMIPAWGFVQAVNAITSNLIGQNRKDEVFLTCIEICWSDYSINVTLCFRVV